VSEDIIYKILYIVHIRTKDQETQTSMSLAVRPSGQLSRLREDLT